MAHEPPLSAAASTLDPSALTGARSSWDLVRSVLRDLPADMRYETMELRADDGLAVAIFTAEPGSASSQGLDLLASWTAMPDHVGEPPLGNGTVTWAVSASAQAVNTDCGRRSSPVEATRRRRSPP